MWNLMFLTVTNQAKEIPRICDSVAMETILSNILENNLIISDASCIFYRMNYGMVLFISACC